MNTIFERMKLRDHFEEGAKLADAVLRDEAFLAAMERGAQLLVEALGSGHKILSCGNGGSMCDAMHFAEELSGRYRDDRKPFAALSLSDPSAMTCIGNDYGFEQVFARQTLPLGQAGRCAPGHQHKWQLRQRARGSHPSQSVGHGCARLDRQRWRRTRGLRRRGGSRAVVWVRRPHPRGPHPVHPRLDRCRGATADLISWWCTRGASCNRGLTRRGSKWSCAPNQAPCSGCPGTALCGRIVQPRAHPVCHAKHRCSMAGKGLDLACSSGFAGEEINELDVPVALATLPFGEAGAPSTQVSTGMLGLDGEARLPHAIAIQVAAKNLSAMGPPDSFRAPIPSPRGTTPFRHPRSAQPPATTTHPLLGHRCFTLSNVEPH